MPNPISRSFVIPPGSQVVLTQTMPTRDGGFKKPGSVGVVMQSPPHNEEPYLVRFTDGATLKAKFDQLTLRRQEIDQQLVDDKTDFKKFIIYKCRVGSRAFGLATKNSDDDLRGIFLPPAEMDWSLYQIPGQIESIEDGEDEVYWELEKFIRLALKANPNILETLWTPQVIVADPIAERLRDIRNSFMSKHIYKTYSGYVLSQFRRMKNSLEKTGKFKNKHAMHLVRLLHSGIGALKNGEITIDVSEHREHLMKIRNGGFSFEEIREHALELDQQFQTAFENTNLPEQPDFATVNQFLIDARRFASMNQS